MVFTALNSTWLLSGSVSVSDVATVVGSVYKDVEAVVSDEVSRPPKLQDARPNTTDAAVLTAKTLINKCLFIIIPLDTNH